MEMQLQQAQLTNEQETILQQLIEAEHDPEEANQWVLDYIPAEQSKRFTVTDDKSANWVLRKLAECDVAEAEIDDMMEAEIKAITDRVEKLLKPIIRNREFFRTVYEPQLEAWATEKLKDSKKRSVSLIHGIVGFKGGRESLVIDDEEAAIALLERLDIFGAIRIVKSVDKTVVKSYLSDVNQRKLEIEVDGAFGEVTVAHIERGEDTFYVKPEMPRVGE